LHPTAHYSSKTVVWGTPQPVFDKLNAEFGFETDVCAIAENAKCPRYFSPEMDGLAQDWTGVCWMNPPYGRGIDAWIKKAYESAQSGATVVCLVPVRSDTGWWHDYCAKGEIRFIRGRLNFTGATGSTQIGHNAPFPCAVVVFRPRKEA
jgi:phage N-6-adenine-methyltransferase